MQALSDNLNTATVGLIAPVIMSILVCNLYIYSSALALSVVEESTVDEEFAKVTPSGKA